MRVNKCLYCGKKKLLPVTKRSDNVVIVRCDECRVMMVGEVSDDTKQLYTREYFEKSEETDHGYATYISSPTINLMGKYGFSRLFSNGMNHLDLGSADGSLMEIFSQYKFNTRGLEISADAVQVAENKGLKATVTNLHTFPSIEKGSVDVMTAFDLLEHVDSPGKVLKNIHQALSDDGVFVFSTLSVKQYDETDYWFNHSLEHYIYYDAESLTKVLTEVFGAGQFGFVEETINGISEFWGFATKGSAKTRHKALDMVRGVAEPRDERTAYFLSLFLNQVSDFARSKRVQNEFSKQWSPEDQTVARFTHYYVQGRIEKALAETKGAVLTVPSTNGIFWRGYYQAEHDMAWIHQKNMTEEWTTKVRMLQEELFIANDKYQTLINSRVVGRIIRGRNAVMRRVMPVVRSSPKQAARLAIHHTKRGVGVFLPMSAKKSIGRKKREFLARVRAGRSSRVESRYIHNEVFDRDHPIVSVVVPYYNRYDTISQTLESLVGQTFSRFEVVLIDDGSTDEKSIKALTQLPSQFKTLNLTVVRQKNAGVAEARNHGIRKTHGKYIVCLDSDDILDPTFIEKALVALENDPDVDLITSYRQDFGARNGIYEYPDYDPATLINDNMVITAAMFRKAAWEQSRGYVAGIGYEDWEYWIQLAEKGSWGKTLREPLFRYRVALQSRFIDDKAVHRNNIRAIHLLHKSYRKVVSKLARERSLYKTYVHPETALINLSVQNDYQKPSKKRQSVLIVIPWMTFGGAETLLYNFCLPLRTKYDIHFVTGEESKNEWEYKFREVTDNIFHLPQLLKSPEEYGRFVSNYVKVHGINIVHIVHSGYLFDAIPAIKADNPDLKVIVTMFNDRVDRYVEKSIEYRGYIDAFNTDSIAVAESYKEKFNGELIPSVIPNGVDCHVKYNPAQYDRASAREALHIENDEIAVVFFGRLSPEKNPNVFIDAAGKVASKKMHFFVIGDGPTYAECSEQVSRLTKGNTKIEMLGYQENVGYYLSAMDILVLPSSVEGFPLSIIEAYAMGVAVIASSVGAVPDVVKNSSNGFVVKPGDAAEIVKRLDEIALKPAQLDAMKKRNREEAKKKYSIEQLSARYDAQYRSVLS